MEECESRGKGGSLGRQEKLGKGGKEDGKCRRFGIEMMTRNSLTQRVGVGCKMSVEREGLGR